MSWSKQLNLKQTDETLSRVASVRDVSRPAKGWVNAIRTALGMSARTLGERVGLTQARVSGIEKGEVNGTITLNTLDKMAQGLGCRVVYFLVPEAGSLQGMREQQALTKAQRLNQYVERHMELEDQATSASFRSDVVKEQAEELLRTWPRDFWDD